MRKTYPYLRENYYPNYNEEQEKRNFLALLDDFVNQRQYVKITLLNWQENALREIEGEITSGSISKDGSSSIRRTGSLSCSVDTEKYNSDSLNMDFSLNKKVFIEIGIKNETNQYPEYPILWFPQGVFVISDFSMNSSSTSALNLNISLKDKMCLLNGTLGGLLPETTQFDIMTTQLSTGEMVEQKILIYNIILELVNHFGGEDLNNIIIEDVPLRIRKVVQWYGSNPVYGNINAIETAATDGYIFQMTKPADYDTTTDHSGWVKYSRGDDIGYVYSDFIVTNELVGSAGSSICTVLDEIKNMLGNYEYFYDEMGIFHFREIRNFLNITQAQLVTEEMANPGRYIKINEGTFLLDGSSEKQYIIETTNEKTMYHFEDDKNVTSITVTPQYANIKNDFIVEGIKSSSSSDLKYPIRYRVVIDEKPYPIGTYSYSYYDENREEQIDMVDRPYYSVYNNVVYYTDQREYGSSNKLAIYESYTDFASFPVVGNYDKIYYAANEEICYYWDSRSSMYKELLYIDDDNNELPAIIYDTYYTFDWRNHLYLYGLQAINNGTDAGPYFTDLEGLWPFEFDLRHEYQYFFGQGEDQSIQFRSLTTGQFFFDMIDSTSSTIGEYSVNNIGRREVLQYDEEINCLFAPEIPNVIFLNADNPTDNWSENTTISDDTLLDPITTSSMLAQQRQECIDNQQPWTQVKNEFFSNLEIGGMANAAYDEIKYQLFCHTRFQKTVSVTAIPVFYLEPNSRVELNSKSTNTYGDFMVQNISITLGPGANMSIVLNEAAERL